MKNLLPIFFLFAKYFLTFSLQKNPVLDYEKSEKIVLYFFYHKTFEREKYAYELSVSASSLITSHNRDLKEDHGSEKTF